MTLSQSFLAFGFIGFAFGVVGVLFAQKIIRIRRSTRAAERRLGR